MFFGPVKLIPAPSAPPFSACAEKGPFKYNPPGVNRDSRELLKARSRQLRKDQTPAESLLWARLRDRKLGGYKFVRQYRKVPYILDFYCPAALLAVELDGSHHLEADTAGYDLERTKFLESCGIKVIRFSNERTESGLEKVLFEIFRELRNRAPHPYREKPPECSRS